jgi:ATP-binding cassette subfamily B protein
VTDSSAARAVPPVRLWRLVELILAAGRRLALAHASLLLAQGLLPLAGLWAMQGMIDALAAGAQAPDKAAAWSAALRWVGIAAGLALFGAAVRAVASYVGDAHARALGDHCTDALVRRASALDLGQVESPQVQDLLHRAGQEAAARPVRALRHGVRALEGAITGSALLVLLASLHWGLAVVVFAVALPHIAVRRRQARQLDAWQQEMAPREREAGYLHGLLTGVAAAKDLRALDLGTKLADRLATLRRGLREGLLRWRARQTRSQVALQALSVAATFACYGWLGWQVIVGALTVGGLVMYVQALQRADAAVQEVLGGALALSEERLFLARLFAFLDLRPTLVAPAAPRAVPPPHVGLRCEGVTFTYPGAARPTLIGVDLTVRPGEMVALVGRNGAGKSTLVRLMCRYHDPQHGHITWEGYDLREFAPEQWRQTVAVSFQDGLPFDLSAHDNITAVDPAADPAPAAHLVDLDARLRALPQGYATRLGRRFEGSVELSGGEWRRLLLARALHRRAPLVVLDEPAAFLDPAAEADLLGRLRERLAGCAVVLVGHHLATVRAADRIVVLDAGRVVDQGSFAELQQRSVLFVSLFGERRDPSVRV